MSASNTRVWRLTLLSISLFVTFAFGGQPNENQQPSTAEEAKQSSVSNGKGFLRSYEIQIVGTGGNDYPENRGKWQVTQDPTTRRRRTKETEHSFVLSGESTQREKIISFETENESSPPVFKNGRGFILAGPNEINSSGRRSPGDGREHGFVLESLSGRSSSFAANHNGRGFIMGGGGAVAGIDTRSSAGSQEEIQTESSSTTQGYQNNPHKLRKSMRFTPTPTNEVQGGGGRKLLRSSSEPTPSESGHRRQRGFLREDRVGNEVHRMVLQVTKPTETTDESGGHDPSLATTELSSQKNESRHLRRVARP